MSPTSLPPADEVVEAVLASSRASAGTLVIVEDGSEVELRFARNSLTTNGIRRTRTVTVACMESRDEGVAAGVVSRSGSIDVEDLVRAARSDAAAATASDDAMPLVEGVPPDADFGDPPVLTTPSALRSILDGLGPAFASARSRGAVLAGFAEHHSETTYLGTSSGIRRRHVQPTGKLEIVARADDGSRSAWAATGTPDLSTVDVGAFEQRLAERLRWAERRIDLPPGRYDALLPPDAVADLMVSLMLYAGSGRDAEDGRTVFSAPDGKTRVGEKLSELAFELRSNPQETGLECAPFAAVHGSSSDESVFDSGMGVGATRWIDAGRLSSLVYHRAGAERSGVEPAPPGGNLILELPGATGSLDDLGAGTDRGLLLTCFWYIRELDPVTLLMTGLTRDGVYLVENGEVVGAVNNFRFNESPVDVLARASGCGATERALGREWNEWVNRTAMPPLRVADFNMSSVSPAT